MIVPFYLLVVTANLQVEYRNHGTSSASSRSSSFCSSVNSSTPRSAAILSRRAFSRLHQMVMKSVRQKAMLYAVSDHPPYSEDGNLPYEADQDAVSLLKPRAVPGEIHIRRDNAAAVATHHLHRNTSPSFQATADVSAVPGHA